MRVKGVKNPEHFADTICEWGHGGRVGDKKERNTSVRRWEAAGECRLAIPFPDRTNLTPLIEGSKWESYGCTHLEYQRTRSNSRSRRKQGRHRNETQEVCSCWIGPNTYSPTPARHIKFLVQTLLNGAPPPTGFSISYAVPFSGRFRLAIFVRVSIFPVI